VGHVLCHDITQIIKGERAGARYQKGHVVTEVDIQPLLDLGKDHLYIYDLQEGMLHEDEAAEILYEACAGESVTMKPTPVSEGKIEIVARMDGLLKVNRPKLQQVNALGDLIVATRHNNTVVKKGEKLAGTRITPLVISKEKMNRVIALAGDEPLLQIKPLHPFKVGVITTGNEVYYKRIKDTFTPVIKEKLATYGLSVDLHQVVPDDVDEIKRAIANGLESGMELIVCTGGMSVDPDDLTPTAIKASGADLLTYGVPVLPGSMLLIGYMDGKIPILGLPGCVMYADATAFDLLLPRILAKDSIATEEMAALGHGGLCLKCQVCTFPRCGFGR